MLDQDFKQFISDLALTHVPEESEPVHGMANGVDVYALGEIRIRVVTDRGQRFLDLWANPEGTWKDVFTLVSVADPGFKPKTGSFAESLRAARTYWPQLATMLGTKRRP